MRKPFRNTVSLALAAAVSLSCLFVQTGAADAKKVVPADGSFVGDAPDFHSQILTLERYGGYYTPASTEPLYLWANGGKATLDNGAAVDGKTLQLYATSMAGDYRYYDVTTAKSTVWGGHTKFAYPAGAEPNSEYWDFDGDGDTEDDKATAANTMTFDIEKGKFPDDPDLKPIAKVAKGKVTAGKEPGLFYVHAITSYDKKNPTLNPVSATPAQVVVNRAPSVVQITNAQPNGKLASADVSGLDCATDTVVNQDAVVKSVTAPVGAFTQVFVQGVYKDGTDFKIAHLGDSDDTDTTYTIQVDPKSIKTIAIADYSLNGSNDIFENEDDPTPKWKTNLNNYKTAANSDAGPVVAVDDWSPSLTLSQSTLLKDGIAIAGLDLAEGKIAKGSITITNNHSGKKAKLSVLVGNPVLGQPPNPTAIAFQVASSGASADYTKEAELKNYLTLSDSTISTTDSPKFVITALDIDNTDNTKSEKKNQDSFIDKGKVKLASDLKVNDGIGKLLSLKYDKNTGKVTVTLKKTATIEEAATAKVEKFNLICAYNAAPAVGEDLPGIVVIPITLTGPVTAVTPPANP